uniref:Pyridoxamine 5'-phosphate oxidase-related, FMN-binding protein n=1 Tax=Mycobacterium sp. (strain JLS) TaxID=164757 RepID=A0A5Q5CHA8_MYCSJ
MTDLSEFTGLISRDHGLCVFSTLRRDGSIQSTVVNAGVLAHPVTRTPVVGLVAAGGSLKLRNLRADPRATVAARAGWQWASVEGRGELIGPDDPYPGIDGDGLRNLLRDGVHRRGRHPRRLGHLRPGDGRGTTHRGARRPAPRVHQSGDGIVSGATPAATGRRCRERR